MEAQAIAQMLAIIFGVLGIIWHQQHNTNQLRAEFDKAINGLRAEFNKAIDGLRAEFDKAINGLRAQIASLEQRLASLEQRLASLEQRVARIEGFLKVGMPVEAAAEPEPAAVERPT